MSENKLTPIIGIISQASIVLFWDKLKSPLIFNFPAGSVADLEVRKVEDLAGAFEDFVGQAKLPASLVYLIISPDLVFGNEFVSKDSEAAKAEAAEFIKLVPFEHLASRIYPFGKGSRVAAVNKEFYEIFQSVLESHENAVVSVTPATVLNGLYKPEATASNLRNILHKLDFVRQNSFVYQEEAIAESEQKGSDPRKNKKLLILLIVFLLLLGALGVVTYVNLIGNKKPPLPRAAEVQNSPGNPPPVQTAVPVQKTDVSAASISASAMKIQILNASGIKGLAGKVKTQLEENGFRSVETGNVSQVSGEKIMISFKPEISAALREAINQLLEKSFSAVSTNESNTSSYDAVITLTKNSNSSNSAQIAP